MTVTGKEADKGSAVQELVKYYMPQFDEKIITFGVGDSPNDAPMLREVDFPYLVQRPDGQWRNLVDIVNLNSISAVGPLGFTEMVNDIKRCWFNQDSKS